MHTPLQDLLSIVRSGLRGRAAQARKVVIVGAGMAGLVAAYELRRAGHEVILLEAARRVGGRILTVREPFTDGLYTEAGAMRIPTTHQLTLAYVDHFRLQTLPFTKTSANAFYFVSGRKTLIPEAAGDPARLGAAFGGPQGGWAAMKSWAAFVHKTRERLQADPDHWEHLLENYGDISFYQFFRQQGWSANAVTALLVVNGLEPVMQRSFIEMLNLELTWLDADMVQIAGGMDRLPEAFLPALREGIRLGVEVVALDYTSDSVTVHCRGEAESEQVSADCAIIAIPYPALRFVDVIPPFSFGKQSAIRQVHYPNAIKIFLHCRRRFWEEDDGIFGGASLTDLPTRGLYYPDHGRDTGQGVLIGCYTYGEEANRWTALLPEERIAQALKYLAKIHPQITQEFVSGASKVWREDRWAGGAFAIFDPGQQARLYPHMITPEGPIYFAGEHTSLKHSWIEGAVESGLRAAQEVHQRAIERTPA